MPHAGLCRPSPWLLGSPVPLAFSLLEARRHKVDVLSFVLCGYPISQAGEDTCWRTSFPTVLSNASGKAPLALSWTPLSLLPSNRVLPERPCAQLRLLGDFERTS